MKTSLLCALRDFRPRDGHDPVENFITEAFAWLLINHPAFGRFYLSKIGRRLGLDDSKGRASIDWTTRLNLGGVFPDLVGIAGSTAYLFEHKAWAHLHPNQLANYRREAEKEYGQGNFHLVLVTGGRHQFDQNPDLALCWHEIHGWISDWQEHSEYESEALFADFQELLESEGMGPPAPVSHESILAYKPAQSFEPNLVALIQRAVHHDWKEEFPLIATDPKLPWHRSLPGGKDPWGRIGINLAGAIENWIPECFLGFLIDPTDHCIQWLNPGCPDFSIILGANTELRPNYPQSTELAALRQALPHALKSTCSDFDYLDHFATCDDPNLWHPIHIRMPMIDLFRGTATADDQYQRFVETASRVLAVLSELPEFVALREMLLTNPPKTSAIQ